MSSIALMGLRALSGKKGDGNLTFKRYAMYHALRRDIGAIVNMSDSALSISHSEPLVEFLAPNAAISRADYPEYNVLDLTLPDGEFPLVVSDQILEHVEGDPAQAMAEMIRVTAPGGVTVVTTCFINPVHGAPKDFWRFTPDALALLAKRVAPSSEILCIGQWGNYYLHMLYGLGLSSRSVRPGRNLLTKLANYNQANWPISTWIVLRRK
ncbi:methyltransferase domain-containing protein [Sphingomonas koreensis]|nr:methyltransferase domain-containing protein [Sphingomonas koreensis]